MEKGEVEGGTKKKKNYKRIKKNTSKSCGKEEK